jgi:hypothetical protein
VSLSSRVQKHLLVIANTQPQPARRDPRAMGRVVALLGACVFALAAPTSANKAWDIFTSAGEENGADATPPKTLTAGATPGADFSEDYEAYYETHPLLVADEAAGVGEEMTGVDDGGTEVRNNRG